MLKFIYQEACMKELIKIFFDSVGIEHYAVLSYSDCKEINPSIIEREDFTPRSVIIFLMPYYTGETVNISRYAASLDYHLALREVTDALICAIREKIPDAKAKGYGDHSPINEVHAALIAGLGIIGDNGLLINEEYGSYIFIGDLVTDIAPELLGAVSPQEVRTCIHCSACKRNCPTGILSGEGEDCLSAITQRKGDLTPDEVKLMRKNDTVWGCDACQSVCPYNKDAKITPISFFHRERIDCLTSEALAAMDKEAFRRRAFAWRGRKTVERNLELLGY